MREHGNDMTKLRGRYGGLVAGAALVALFVASPAFGECTFFAGALEWGVMAGAGDNVHIRNNVREDVEFYTVIPHWGTVFWEWDGCRSLQFNVEGFLASAREDEKNRYAVGITPMFRLNIADPGRVVPFIEVGAGIVYTDLAPDGFGSSFAFTPQGGAGLRFELRPGRYLTLTYRFHHISNAGIEDDNASIDSHFLMLGVSVVR